MAMLPTGTYFSVAIPYVAKGRTVWHPEKPGQVLTRGSFASIRAARDWARTHIPGHKFTVKSYRVI